MSSNTKLIICILIILSGIGCYLIYKNKNKPVENLLKPDLLQEFKKNLQKGIYFLSKTTNTLYFKSTEDGGYYKVKDGTSCQGILKNAIIIRDVYNIIKDENTGKYNLIMIQTAKEYEDSIIKILLGEVTPTPAECIDPVEPSGFAVEYQNIISRGINTFEDYCSSKLPNIINFAKTMGPIMTASLLLKQWTFLVIVIPQFCSGNPQEQLAGGVFTGFEFTKIGLEKLRDITVAWDAAKVEKTIQESTITTIDGKVEVSVVKGAERVAIDASVELAVTLKYALESILQLVSKLLSGVEMLMLIGMIVDIFDPCNLNSGLMTQNVLESLKQSYDKMFHQTMSNLGMDITSDFKADMICDYKIMPQSQFWSKCLNDTEKAKTDLPTFIKNEGGISDDDKLKNYVNEYIEALTVNSQGMQITKNMTNDSLAKMFKNTIGGDINWDAISDMNPNDVKNFLTMDNKELQKFDLLLTGQNVLYAAYLNQYFYVFLIFFIIIVFTIYNV